MVDGVLRRNEKGSQESRRTRRLTGGCLHDNHEQIRVDAVNLARRTGTLDQCLKLVDECLADYDLDGSLKDTWL